jgi:DNA ligase-1
MSAPAPPAPAGPHFVLRDDVRAWFEDAAKLSDFTRSIGNKTVSSEYLAEVYRLPLHLQLVVRKLVEEQEDVGIEALASIPFYSLCKGLFLPLSAMSPDKVAQLFGIAAEPPPDTAGREALLQRFLEKDLGLNLVQKLSCVLGDPFRGRGSTFKRDSLVRLLLSMRLSSRRAVLDRLTQVGDISVLFAEGRPLQLEPALTAAEVLETLRFLPYDRGAGRFDVLRSLYDRCGRIEAYFLTKLVLKKAGFGYEYEGPLVARAVAERFGAPVEMVQHAMALTDVFKVADILSREGQEGLRAIQIQPLVPVRPALATGAGETAKKYPTWVERKYDGIRFMLHKSTDARGSVLCAAYTRNRRDWLELVNGLDATIKAIPAKNAIIDGELYGTVLDLEGARPGTVYEVYHTLHGDSRTTVNLKFAAFDLLYLNGQDLTRLPLRDRRNRLQALLGPMSGWPTAISITVAEGQLASNKEDVNRLYGHFRSQGYEGIISKDLDGAYALAERDPTWTKRKPEETLDLALLGGVFAVTEKKSTGLFGSYVIGALTADGGFQDVGDVAGVDRVRDAEIQGEIMREGLITGRRIERQSASGVRPGIELKPHIVVTVRFEGIVRDNVSGELRMRDPKLVAIRADKNPTEANSVKDIEEMYLRQRVG